MCFSNFQAGRIFFIRIDNRKIERKTLLLLSNKNSIRYLKIEYRIFHFFFSLSLISHDHYFFIYVCDWIYSNCSEGRKFAKWKLPSNLNRFQWSLIFFLRVRFLFWKTVQSQHWHWLSIEHIFAILITGLALFFCYSYFFFFWHSAGEKKIKHWDAR